MASCTVYSQLTKYQFERKTCVFRSRRDVLYFLLNILLTIKASRKQLCYCLHKKRCVFCKIKRQFRSVEYDLYNNIFDLDFLT